MASQTVQWRLQALTNASTPSASKATDYQNLLEHITSASPPEDLAEDLSAFITSVLNESLGIVAARPLLGAYVQALKRLPDPHARIGVGEHALAALAPRTASFEDQDADLRKIVADAYTATEDFAAAARTLSRVNLDSSTRRATDAEKVQRWVEICRLYLEEDDATAAEPYLNRAKQLLHRVPAEDRSLRLLFGLAQARILDARRRFPEASAAYHEVSLTALADEADRARALAQAIVCAVLAPAGPQRARLLGTLYRDERAPALDEFGILEKVFLDHVITPAEADAFAQRLEAHQLARTADGSTVLAAAVSEHNLRAASTLYRNLGTRELGALLGLDADKAERYAARMLEQGRLTGRIDQIEGVVYFEDPELGGGGAGGGAAAGAAGGTAGGVVLSEGHGVLRQWDRNVQALVEDVERVSSLLQAEMPAFAAAHAAS